MPSTNTWRCAGAGALAEELLQACPGLRIVATSQHPLGVVGESMWQVPPLSLPGPDSPASLAGESGALRLFVERATAAKGEFDLDAESTLVAAEICRRLDGIPLAIELAAARVDVLSLPEIASRLDDRFRLLDGGARGARSDRSGRQSLEAALDWSYDLLGARAPAAALPLGVHRRLHPRRGRGAVRRGTGQPGHHPRLARSGTSCPWCGRLPATRRSTTTGSLGDGRQAAKDGNVIEDRILRHQRETPGDGAAATQPIIVSTATAASGLFENPVEDVLLLRCQILDEELAEVAHGLHIFDEASNRADLNLIRLVC